MAGTKIGGVKAVDTTRRRHGERFYAQIGRIGGSRGHTGGFYGNRELASAAGRLGGMVSRRGHARGRKLTDQEKRALRRRKEIKKAFEHLERVKQKAMAERTFEKHMSFEMQ